MDELDKELLNEIQSTFPLVTRPFDAIAKKFDTTPKIIKEHLNNLKKVGILRQLSAIFDTRKLGYTSSLVAMEIEHDKLEYVASQINRHPGVSHNYEREHQFNLWFTLAVPPGADLKTEVDKFNVLKGIKKVRMLPTLQLFKIGVKLDMVDEKKHEIAPTEKKKEIKNVKFEPTEEDKNFIRELQKDMEIIDEPFVKAAKNLGITENELFDKMKHYEDIGVMRRFAAILRHRKVGFTANGMIVWKVPEDRISEVGEKLGAFPQVSHCYERPTYSDWPYNVFSMIHCKTHDEAHEMAKTIQEQIQVPDYDILFSSREFKKIRVEYFVEKSFTFEETITAS
ncbi:Lrp/AsnC family transcriptional regulator [Marine Group I thaumarchaeote]|uniref:siroheme decarboxylase n=1 Tax=Marine Group I thaumarchaeote TaxID=2511932 RepID=A0A7K4P3H2_9ARCH|nr:MAG: Lrp/AsnC family transcriptional regulator [Nitrosopumilus sp. YT1]NMI81664.1 Lrp/AsnC family transcriptional regulator [Candidatus Nitrosopumilus sp. MTA1]NWJ19600.1 Lrp/AsnC family transcriptional regulator [Marine Group I thaumarchaeote]NWJ28501.1 Lrp/AsnC family transcriptional regulator [Marine Group I thaumarchaeote]NWJ56831.1 Lrp/AsnC family transcriptional regulator [Marine Group I thaumarchaeote]